MTNCFCVEVPPRPPVRRTATPASSHPAAGGTQRKGVRADVRADTAGVGAPVAEGEAQHARRVARLDTGRRDDLTAVEADAEQVVVGYAEPPGVFGVQAERYCPKHPW